MFHLFLATRRGNSCASDHPPGALLDFPPDRFVDRSRRCLVNLANRTCFNSSGHVAKRKKMSTLGGPPFERQSCASIGRPVSCVKIDGETDRKSRYFTSLFLLSLLASPGLTERSIDDKPGASESDGHGRPTAVSNEKTPDVMEEQGCHGFLIVWV